MSTTAISMARAARPAHPSWAVYTTPVRIGNTVLNAGLYHHGKRGEQTMDDWLASPIWVTARVIDTDNGVHGRMLRYTTHHGQNEWVMPMEMLSGSGEEIRRELLRRGAEISTDSRCRQLLTAYLMAQQPDETLVTTCQIGWLKSGGFVLPETVIGGNGVRYVGDGSNAFAISGTLKGWQEGVATPSLGNPILVLGICIALAGPLLKILQINGGGVHLVGRSSTGKTLSQLIGGSVWGNPGRDGFVCSWDMSRVGVENLASSRNDTVLCLDEISRGEPTDIQRIVYAVANGQGKATMTRDRGAGQLKTWRILMFSSGERSLAEYAALSGNPAHAGAELRMIDIAADRQHGVFDTLHGHATSADLHRHLTMAINEHHGLAGIEFVKRLVGEDELRIQSRFKDLRTQFSTASPQGNRIADRFALIATAGELATEYKLLPWQQGEALAAMRQLFIEWLATAGGGEAEDRRVMRQLADFIERHSNRFAELRAGMPKPPNCAGYLQRDTGGKQALYLFNRSGLAEACPGLGLDRVVRILSAAGVIATHDRGRQTKKIRLPDGGMLNAYAIDPNMLSS